MVIVFSSLWSTTSAVEGVTIGVLKNFEKLTGKCQRLQACNFIKKETLAQVFSCEFCETVKNTFFTEHLWTTTSKCAPSKTFLVDFPQYSELFFWASVNVVLTIKALVEFTSVLSSIQIRFFSVKFQIKIRPMNTFYSSNIKIKKLLNVYRI